MKVLFEKPPKLPGEYNIKIVEVKQKEYNGKNSIIIDTRFEELEDTSKCTIIIPLREV